MNDWTEFKRFLIVAGIVLGAAFILFMLFLQTLFQ